MMTPRENFLELLKRDGRPERQLDQYEALNLVLYDPINAYLRGNRRRGTTSRDRWGTVIDWPEDAPGAMPHVTDDTKVIKDITHCAITSMFRTFPPMSPPAGKNAGKRHTMLTRITRNC